MAESKRIFGMLQLQAFEGLQLVIPFRQIKMCWQEVCLRKLILYRTRGSHRFRQETCFSRFRRYE